MTSGGRTEATRVLLALDAPISAFAFNSDESLVALCPSTNEVHIYEVAKLQAGGSVPPPLHVLARHDMLVTGIDWAPRTNRIVTCSQDRNAYVWTFANASWAPTLVLLRMARSATCVRWAPSEEKFAVGSGAGLVAVCYFEAGNDWWLSKHYRGNIRGSTVLALAWHPNSVVLGVGGTDACLRVFSAYIKGVDEKPPRSAWGEKLPFSTLCAEIPTHASWVHAVAFSPSGALVAASAHGSRLIVYDPTQPDRSAVVDFPALPLLSLSFASKTEILAAGHDCCPVVLKREGDTWKYAGRVIQGSPMSPGSTSTDDQDDVTGGSNDGINSAMARFRAMDLKGQSSVKNEQLSGFVHQSAVREIRLLSQSRMATGATDGRLVMWDLTAPSFKNPTVAN